MIVKIIFSKPENGMRIDNQHYVNGFIHKCLGKNNKYVEKFEKEFEPYSIDIIESGKGESKEQAGES